MVDISSQNNKINVTVSSSGNTANTNVTPDYAQYYSEKSKEWAISNRIVDNTDYSSKYYANESKKQADISTAKASEVVESGNTAVSNIENARDNAIINVNTAGATQVALATEQATIATNKTSEVVASGNEALSNIDTAKNNAITSITNQETISKTNLIDEGATQIGLIQNEGATQVANVQSTGFYMRYDKLYYINSQGEETEFKSGGSGLEVCDIGMSLFVDETKGLRRYINGQIVDRNTNTEEFFTRLQKITTLHPSLLDTEENWQAAKTLSPFGQVGKFVFNYSGDKIVSVRLPRVVNVQGLFDLQNLGMTVSESLPNITGSYTDKDGYSSQNIGTGAFRQINSSNTSTYVGATQMSRTYSIMEFDASLSSSTYQDNAPVQQEAIQYPYFIQVATGSETENNIVNDIELNNPYVLFKSEYFEAPPYNLSWLKSDGEYKPKATYIKAYEALVVENNSSIAVGTTVDLPSGTKYTKRGLSVKLSTATDITDYDFVLNTADETFRLPIKTKLASGKAVVGNGKALMLTNGTQTGALSACGSGATGNVGGFLRPVNGVDGINIGDTAKTTVGTQFDTDKAIGIVTDPTKSGIETDTTGLYLYFYVGETVQNANLIDAGRIGEQLATKTDMLQASGAGMPSSKYINLTLGASGSTYTAPANGWFSMTLQPKGAGIVSLDNLTTRLYNQIYVTTQVAVQLYIPAKRGDVVKIEYLSKTSDASLNYLTFIYAEGEV